MIPHVPWHTRVPQAQPVSEALVAATLRAPAASGGGGSSTRPVFTSSTQGEVPASGGGTTNFMRADGTWASPGASSLTVTEVDIDFGTAPVKSKSFTVVDAAVGVASKVCCFQSGKAATGGLDGDAETSPLVLAALPAVGSFTLYATCVDGFAVGKLKIHYFVV